MPLTLQCTAVFEGPDKPTCKVRLFLQQWGKFGLTQPMTHITVLATEPCSFLNQFTY